MALIYPAATRDNNISITTDISVILCFEREFRRRLKAARQPAFNTKIQAMRDDSQRYR